jgi:4-amino-4-deoxy-L-arabinose transferase-like glycosyltransferase
LSSPPTPRWVRVGLGIVVAIYLTYSAFGIAAPFYWGHHGYHGATYMLRARTSLRQHMVAPATWTGYDPPPPAALYFHHPIGYHHLLTVTVPIFGEREWLPRALAALGGLAALWAMYRLVRRAWSPGLGLLAVAVYVSLPVVTSFSVLSDPMLLELACVLWGLRAYLDYLERPSRRLLVEAALSYGIGGLMMWEVFFIGPFIALHGLLYRKTARGRELAITAWNGPSVRVAGLALHPTTIHTLVIGTACVAVMAFHVWFTAHAGVWGEFLDSYKLRHSPPSASYVLDRHTQWMELLYGAPPLIVAALWYVVFVARLALGHLRTRDLAVLTFLYTNTLYIYLFAEGSSVHLYRVFFYSGFFALAAVDLVDELARGGRRLFPGLPPRIAGGLVAGAAIALYFRAEIPHAWANLIESRALMGTHGETHYSPHDDQWLFAKDVTRLTTPTDRVILHYPSMGARKELWFYLDRSMDEVTAMAQVDKFRAGFGHSVLVYDDRSLGAADRAIAETLMREHPTRFYDRFIFIDLRKQGARIEGWGFSRGRITPAYRFWVSHLYGPLSLVRKANITEVCTALRLGVPLATDEDAPATDGGQRACYAEYLRRRAATVSDTIEPPPPSPSPSPSLSPSPSPSQ